MTAAPRQLGLLDVSCIGINAIVGSSIFLFPGLLAGHLGPASIAAFGLTGALLVPVGLCFAEASRRFERSGGPYLYAGDTLGAQAGFGIGWMCWVTSIFGWAAVANAVPAYLGHFGGVFSKPVFCKGMTAAVILFLGAMNYRGVRAGAWTSNFFTAAKLIPLAVFVAWGLPHVSLAGVVPFAPKGWSGLGPACFLAYFAFQGFEVVPVPSGEVRDPARNVPIALVGALVGAAVLYMLVQWVAVNSYPALAGSQRPLAEAAERLMGGWGAALIVAGAVCSTTGFCSGTALVAPRYLVALAEGGDIPRWWGVPHPDYGTPGRAVVATTGLTLAAAMALDFGRLVDFSNVVVCAQYVATCAAVWVWRRREGRRGGFLPLAGIAVTLWLGAQGGLAQVWWSLGLLAAGFGLRRLARTQGIFALRGRDFRRKLNRDA